jgi:OmcA/MtrC family decaheme c-type cytochrome
LPEINKMKLLKTGFLAVLAAVSLAFAGCKGSDGTAGANGANGTSCSTHDNGDGTVTISCTDGTSATVSNGAAGAAGAAGSPGADGTSCTLVGRTITCGTSSITLAGGVVDYTLLSAAERADALPSIVVTGVDFSGATPVVTFKVSDRKGNGLAGFTKADPLSTATPPANNAGNFRLGLLKLVPGSGSSPGVNGSANDTWVSYNSADAVHTGSAVTASATTLKEPAGDGTYVYTFPATSFGGTTYDANATHRLAIIMSASGNPYQPVNVVQDFIPATGADVTGQNDKVDGAACLECHKRFRAPAGGTGVFHGGARYDVRVCVACHNDQRRFTTLSSTTVGDAAIQADGTWTGNLAIVNGEGFINLPVFIHKIHMGEELTLRGGTYPGLAMPYEVTYPQDVRNCTKCHRTPAGQTTLADNWKNKPSRRACGACHDNRAFLSSLVIPGTSGYVRDLHSGGEMTDDSTCATCHTATGANTIMDVVTRHQPVAPPDPNSTYSGGTNANTNAAFLAAAGAVPPGAAVITYDVQSVSRDAAKHPVMVFKLKRDGTDVVFNTFATGGELITGFVGSPSVYFVWSMPQDGIAAPADFNASASGYIKTLWATGGAGFTGPDASGYYTATLTATTVPDNATMLTGGVGYTYSLSSTQPLTQRDLPDYPYDTTTKVGGLIVPAPDVWKVAGAGCTAGIPSCTAAGGYTARRAVVENARCKSCHAFLGANPTFHAGQRNDGPTCSFCHNPNQTTGGWAGNVKDFIHGIHGAGKREVPFTWHAESATAGFWLVTYPGVLNSCEMCHLPGTYDFSAAASAAAVPNLLSSTVGQGRYNSNPTQNPNSYFTIAPYVTSNNQVDYGYGYRAAAGNLTYTLPDGLSGTQGAATCSPASPCTCTAANPCSVTVGTSYTAYNVPLSFRYNVTGGATCTDAAPCTCVTNPATGTATNCIATVATCSASAPCNAQPTTLVKTPITAACSACHDDPIAIDHMQTNGGRFYEARSIALPAVEQCLLCHGPGKLAAIADVHK